MSTKNRNIKIKREGDGKINLFVCCTDCGFKKLKAIDEEELGYLIEVLILLFEV